MGQVQASAQDAGAQRLPGRAGSGRAAGVASRKDRPGRRLRTWEACSGSLELTSPVVDLLAWNTCGGRQL